jgi:hypothetical protein
MVKTKCKLIKVLIQVSMANIIDLLHNLETDLQIGGKFPGFSEKWAFYGHFDVCFLGYSGYATGLLKNSVPVHGFGLF